MHEYRIFLSHSSKNRALGESLKAYLEGAKGRHDGTPELRVFLAEYDIPPGKDFDAYILEELRRSDVLVLLLSKEASQSAYVNQEIGVAIKQGLEIVPFVLEAIEPPGMLRRIQCVRAYENPAGYQEWLKRFLTNKATSKATQETVLLIGLIVGAVWLLSRQS